MRLVELELWQTQSRPVRAPRGLWRSRAAMLIAWFAGPLPALAQDNVVATATLPRDLSPWRMYLNADPVVKAVLIGLVFASMGAARDRARTRGRHSGCGHLQRIRAVDRGLSR